MGKLKPSDFGASDEDLSFEKTIEQKVKFFTGRLFELFQEASAIKRDDFTEAQNKALAKTIENMIVERTANKVRELIALTNLPDIQSLNRASTTNDRIKNGITKTLLKDLAIECENLAITWKTHPENKQPIDFVHFLSPFPPSEQDIKERMKLAGKYIEEASNTFDHIKHEYLEIVADQAKNKTIRQYCLG